jgi:hypothetical protein
MATEMSADDSSSDEDLVEAISRWRNQAMTRWTEAVRNSVVADELRIELADVKEGYENLLKERDILLDQVADLKDQVAGLVGSTSWRITRPLRFLSGLLGGSPRRD